MSPSLKVSQPKLLAKERQWEDDRVPEQQKKKGKGKKKAGEKDRYRFVKDIQILASMNALKKLLN